MTRLLWLLLLLSTVLGANAMVYTLRGSSLSSTVFGLLAGGEVELDMNVSGSDDGGAPYVFLVCTYAEAMEVEVEPKDPATCAPSALHCAHVTEFNTTLARRFAIAEYNTYYLCVVHCPRTVNTSTATASWHYALSARLVLTNPGSEQLTCGLMPYPALFGCLAGLWVVALVTWLVFVIASLRRVTRLQVALSAFPMVKIAHAVLAVSWWRAVSSLGRNPSGALAGAYWTFLVLGEVAFFFICMALGAGWGISSISIKRDSPTILLISVLVGVATALDSSLKDDSVTQLTIWLAHVLLRVTAVLFSFVMVNRNIQDLDAHAAFDGAGIEMFTERRNIMLSYKQLLVVWLIADLSIYFALLVFVKDWVWVPEMFYECIVLLFFMCLIVVLHVRPVPVIAAERGQVDDRPLHNVRLQQRVAQLIQQQQRQPRRSDDHPSE